MKNLNIETVVKVLVVGFIVIIGAFVVYDAITNGTNI